MPVPMPRGLAEYQRKRRFDETPEPSGDGAAPDGAPAGRFVVHEHHARRLHWDLRLERDGVLVSATMPPDEARWAFEVKWDGVRAIAHSEPGRLSFITRNGNDVSAAYPELRALNRALGSHAAILDGEIVAFDEQGRPSFQALQPRIH